MASPTEETAPISGAPQPRSRSVAFYLFALVLVILVPALVVSLVLLQRNNQAQEDVVRSLTNATVQAIVQSIDREVSSMITTLRVLSTTESLSDNDLARFHERAVVALAGSGAYLLILDRNFQQLLNTRVPFGSELGMTSDPQSAQRALDDGLPTVSDLFFGQTAQQWVFNVLLPVSSVQGDPMLMALTQNGINLSEALQSRQLPDGWHAALVDRANKVIAATPDSDLEIGSLLPLRQVPKDNGGEWQREMLDGSAVVTAESRSLLSGWRVVAWATAEAVERPLGQSLLWLAAWGVVIAMAAGVVALVIAQRIGGSVRGLRRDAAALGAGKPVQARSYAVAEIADVSNALALASQQRQAAEAQVHFLMRELAHRSKNQMTVITAMAKQTARGATDIAAYVQDFEKRLIGLARSTDLLLTNGVVGVSLADLVHHQIGPFSPASARVDISGPQVRLNPKAAQILGMAMHELSTNAVKYGAFSGDAGTLKVRWSLDGTDLVLVWRETVAALAPISDHAGFGTTVLQTMVAGSLGAGVERIAHEDGLEWRFTIPRAAIAPDAPTQGNDE